MQPDGAFYAWADCSQLVDTLGWQGSWDVALAGSQRAHIAITPGRDCGSVETGSVVRFSTANSMDQLQTAIARLRQLLA